MKLLITLLLSISSMASFAQGPQAWPDAFDQEAVNIIKDQLGAIKVEGEISMKKVLELTSFPFNAGSKTYTKETFADAFSELFPSELLDELTSSESYEAMNPEGDAYMNVCMNTPSGYDGAVVTFKLVEGKWMLSQMDLF